MDRFIKSIDNQIKYNQGKNILHDNPELFKFISDTINAISKINELNSVSKNFLIDYATDKALEEFCRVNQYYAFNSKSKQDLRKIYSDLLEEIRVRKNSIDTISNNHYQKLKDWLIKYNSFAEILYSNANQLVEPVPCSEYNSELQMEILKIDIKKIMLPVLDVGCGKQGKLVKFLESKGIEVYGIDRFSFSSKNLHTSDWLEYDYGIKKWGTIISNLGFSNHFIHHNLRKDGDYIQYAKTYMNILQGLKTGGCFMYAPDIPFIEQYLDSNQFTVHTYEIENYDFKTTHIVKIN